jgi:hypothetical protein
MRQIESNVLIFNRLSDFYKRKMFMTCGGNRVAAHKAYVFSEKDWSKTSV